MVAPESVISVGARHAIQDMVELEMYLLAKSQQMPWQILQRRTKKPDEVKKPHSNLIDFSVANELVVRGLIEATSNRTFVVSKSGHQYYEREMKPIFGLHRE